MWKIDGRRQAQILEVTVAVQGRDDGMKQSCGGKDGREQEAACSFV